MESDGKEVITRHTLLIEYRLNTLDYDCGRVAGRNMFLLFKMALQRKANILVILSSDKKVKLGVTMNNKLSG